MTFGRAAAPPAARREYHLRVSTVDRHEREYAFDDMRGKTEHQGQFENVLKWGLPRRVVQAGCLVGLDFIVLTGWVRLLAPTDDAVGEASRLRGIYANGGEETLQQVLGGRVKIDPRAFRNKTRVDSRPRQPNREGAL